MRATVWVSMMVLAAASVAAAAAPPPLTADQLVYPGAKVETRIDVDGAAAMYLLGGAVDAAATEVKRGLQEDLQEVRKRGLAGEAEEEVAEELSTVDSVRDALKSLTGVKVVVMKKTRPVNGDAFLKHYRDLMTPRGWSPLLTLQDADGTAMLGLEAPGRKGIFFAINDDDTDVVCGLITTGKPLGDLIAKAIQGGRSALGPLLGMATGSLLKLGHQPGLSQPPAAAAQPEPAPTLTQPESVPAPPQEDK